MTTTFDAIASRAAKPKLSVFDGRINKSEWQSSFSTSCVFPKNCTLSIFLSLMSCFANSNSGPSPINLNLHLIFFEIF